MGTVLSSHVTKISLLKGFVGSPLGCLVLTLTCLEERHAAAKRQRNSPWPAAEQLRLEGLKFLFLQTAGLLGKVLL